MRKLFSTLVLALAVMCIFTACDLLPNIPNVKENTITIEGGYLVVNGVKTDYQIKTDDVVEIVDGYVVVNGIKTQYQVKTDDVIEVIDGYVYVNGVKTDIYVPSCNHSWTTVTIYPTCTAGGYDAKTCSLCGKNVVDNETAKLGHTYGSTYSSDDNNHWLECENCDVKKDIAVHTPDDDGVCTVCQAPISATHGIIYDISADKTYAEVVGYEGTATNIKIAAEYMGLPVKTIYKNAFSNNTTITTVVIPDSVVSIGDCAFFCCKNLTSIVIPDSVIAIGERAFAGDPAVSMESLESVVIGNSVTSISNSVFSMCTNLKYLTIGNSVTNIGNSAFYSCSTLSSIEIPGSVTTIGNGAFSGCSALSSIEIPGSVTIIGDSAFSRCSNLSFAIIPDSVLNIGNGAFSGCHSSLYTEHEYGKYVRSGNNPYAVLIEITNKNMSTYAIHEDTKIIASNAFNNCSRLTSITIPDSVTTVGNYAFYQCSNLASVIIPKSVRVIGYGAFYNCSNLASVVILNKATKIGHDAFHECYKLDDIYYVGSQQEWDAVYGDGKDPLSATIHYNYVPTP